MTAFDTSFDLRLLRSFAAVAEELHFGRAADRLMIAQPALSRQISRLEEQLGVKLLDRSTREVTLTAAGETFLAATNDILAYADRAAVSEGTIGSVTHEPRTDIGRSATSSEDARSPGRGPPRPPLRPAGPGSRRGAVTP